MEARALFALAQQAYDEALDRNKSSSPRMNRCRWLPPKRRSIRLRHAVDQVNAALEQAKAARAVLEVQLTKTLLSFPTRWCHHHPQRRAGEMT